MQDLIIDQFQPCSVASPLKQQPSIKFRSDQERMLVQPELSVLEACLPLTTQLTLELATACRVIF